MGSSSGDSHLPRRWAHGCTAAPGPPAPSAAGAAGPQVGACVLSPLLRLSGRVALLSCLHHVVARGALARVTARCRWLSKIPPPPSSPDLGGSRGRGGWECAPAGSGPLPRGGAYARARSLGLCWPRARSHPQLCEVPGAPTCRAFGSPHPC